MLAIAGNMLSAKQFWLDYPFSPKAFENLISHKKLKGYNLIAIHDIQPFLVPIFKESAEYLCLGWCSLFNQLSKS